MRVCRWCKREALYAHDIDHNVIQLEPFTTRGSDVMWGWWLDGHRWLVHHYWRDDIERAARQVFPTHKCRVVPTKGDSVSDPFATPKPPGSGGPSNAELQGRLVLLTVHRIERDIVTTAGVSDAVRADIVDLTSGEEHTDSRLWGKLLVQQFEPGSLYVGRIDKGQAQPGKSAPWVFNPGDDGDKATASRYLQHVAASAPPSNSAQAFKPNAPAASSGGAPPWA